MIFVPPTAGANMLVLKTLDAAPGTATTSRCVSSAGPATC